MNSYYIPCVFLKYSFEYSYCIPGTFLTYSQYMCDIFLVYSQYSLRIFLIYVYMYRFRIYFYYIPGIYSQYVQYIPSLYSKCIPIIPVEPQHKSFSNSQESRQAGAGGGGYGAGCTERGPAKWVFATPSEAARRLGGAPRNLKTLVLQTRLFATDVPPIFLLYIYIYIYLPSIFLRRKYTH